MKITLIHGKYFNSWEALGLAYIGGYLRQELGSSIEIDFFQGIFDDDDDVIKQASNSDIVAFSCTTPSFPYAERIAGKLKRLNPKIHTVVGGYHASAVPNETIKSEYIDQVVVGEGETAMLAIVRGNREPILHGARSFFDNLPWPDRELIKNERTIEVAVEQAGQRITAFQSHRGCPFRCKYCLDGENKVLYPEFGVNDRIPIGYRDVDDLLDEIEAVTERYNLDLFKFTDPTWNTSIPWVLEFCRKKIARKIDVPFYPAVHAGLVTEEMAHLLKEAGCHEVACGVESGSPKILKQIGKGTSVKTIKRGVRFAQKAGIIVRGYFILGMPDENEEDIRLTEKLAEELELDEYGFTILCPYPGTTMYDPKLHANIDWENTDEYGNDFWHTNHLSNKELHKWQAYLVEKFSDNICWHNKVLAENDYNLDKTLEG